MAKINVTIWNEFRHEKEHEAIRKIYPEGIHGAIARGIAADDLNIRLASLDEPEHGLTDEVIAKSHPALEMQVITSRCRSRAVSTSIPGAACSTRKKSSLSPARRPSADCAEKPPIRSTPKRAEIASRMRKASRSSGCE